MYLRVCVCVCVYVCVRAHLAHDNFRNSLLAVRVADMTQISCRLYAISASNSLLYKLRFVRKHIKDQRRDTNVNFPQLNMEWWRNVSLFALFKRICTLEKGRACCQSQRARCITLERGSVINIAWRSGRESFSVGTWSIDIRVSAALH